MLDMAVRAEYLERNPTSACILLKLMENNKRQEKARKTVSVCSAAKPLPRPDSNISRSEVLPCASAL